MDATRIPRSPAGQTTVGPTTNGSLFTWHSTLRSSVTVKVKVPVSRRRIRLAATASIHGETTETVLVVDLPRERIDEVRRIWPFFRDRRPDAYDAIIAP